MSERNYKLTDADLRKSWFTWIMFDCCSNNWERMQNIDWALAMAPTLRKLYQNDDKAFAERLTESLLSVFYAGYFIFGVIHGLMFIGELIKGDTP